MSVEQLSHFYSLSRFYLKPEQFVTMNKLVNGRIHAQINQHDSVSRLGVDLFFTNTLFSLPLNKSYHLFSDYGVLAPKSSVITLWKQIQKVTSGLRNLYVCRLELVGAGYRVGPDSTARVLRFDLGYSHFIILLIPSTISVLYFRQHLIFTSFDQMCLNSFVKQLRTKFRRPSAYKQRGFGVFGHVVRFKVIKR